MIKWINWSYVEQALTQLRQRGLYFFAAVAPGGRHAPRQRRTRKRCRRDLRLASDRRSNHSVHVTSTPQVHMLKRAFIYLIS